MNKYLITILLFSFIYFLSGCDLSKKPATGFEDEIYIVADSVEYEKLNESLQKTFEVQINTPLPEKLFTIKKVSPAQISKFENKKNIVLVSTLSTDSKTSKLIDGLIDEATRRRFLADKDYIHYIYDLWAKDQLVAIISAKDLTDLDFKIEKNKDSLLVTFQRESDNRLKESLYNPKYELKNIQSKLLLNYGWVIYAHKDYKLDRSNKKEKFVSFKSFANKEKEKSLFVFWIDSASHLYLNPDSVKSIRNKVAAKYFSNSLDSTYIVLIDSLVNTTEINFNGRYALYTQGLWKNTKDNSVGPFVNYTLYDDVKKRIYMLDGTVNAPKYYKRNLIQQVDVMLQSFRTVNDLSDERIDELVE
jgi:hypothetical protein